MKGKGHLWTLFGVLAYLGALVIVAPAALPLSGAGM
jgi:hypothetical protein